MQKKVTATNTNETWKRAEVRSVQNITILTPIEFGGCARPRRSNDPRNKKIIHSRSMGKSSTQWFHSKTRVTREVFFQTIPFSKKLTLFGKSERKVTSLRFCSPPIGRIGALPSFATKWATQNHVPKG